MRKRGSLEILSFIPLMVLMLMIFGFGSYVLYNVFSEINPNVQERLGTEGDAVMDNTNSLVNGFGNIFVIILGGAVLFVIISGVMREEHPVMFIVSIIVLFGLLAAGYAMSQAFDKLDESSQFAAASTQYGIMGSLLSNIPLIVLALIIIGGIVTYVKYKG